MKKDYQELILSLDTDVTGIPGRINSSLAEFENMHAKHPIYPQEFCGHWSGLQFNSRKVLLHKDDAVLFKSLYPKFF